MQKTIQENFQWKSLCNLSKKNETYCSQPRIRRYCRPWMVNLAPDTEMLRWYPTDFGFMGFNQPLVDQDLSGLFLELYPSGVELIPLLTLRYFTRFSNKKPFTNGLFSLEREQSYDYSSSFATTQFLVGQNTKHSEQSLLGWDFEDAKTKVLSLRSTNWGRNQKKRIPGNQVKVEVDLTLVGYLHRTVFSSITFKFGALKCKANREFIEKSCFCRKLWDFSEECKRDL